jgi:preprotein translocase subunit SecA
MQKDRGDQIQQAQKSKSKIDLDRASAQQADSTNMGFRGAKQQEGQNGNQQQRGSAPGEKRQPVSVDDEPGRNDYVKVQNMGSGETKELKWKYAKKMVNEDGWILVEK